MKAAVIRKHGEAGVIAVEQVADPEARPGEVVVDLQAAALNHLDIWVRRGGRVALEWPHVIGSDGAGVVAALGESVHGIEVGREVIINPGLSCGCCEFCRSGEQSLCSDFSIVGMGRPGTFAEKVAVPARCVAPKPAHLSFEESAGLGIAYTTAWRMLMTRARVRPGEAVLIHGIGGGVALAALQIARLASARPIVTSSADDKLAKAAALGADAGVNYLETEDVAAAVRSLTDGRGVDVVVDTVGAATWPIDFAAVRRGGRIVICGVTSGPEAHTDLRALYWNQLTVLGSTLGSDEDFRSMLAAVEATELKPVVDSVFPLDDVLAATKRLEAGHQFGKIALAIA
ncbi:MAG: zinc-binding dehydrogenase [Planctomycetota bacterium]|jgi:NADPH:quinone reductase-like Zn-dependent oxidoreductase